MAANELKLKIPKPTYENKIWKGVEINLPEGYFQIGERLYNQLKNNPDFVGQIDSVTGEKRLFSNISERSIKCALWLKKQGVKPGSVVSFCSKNHFDRCIPLFATYYLGAIFNPWWDCCLTNAAQDADPSVKIIIFGKKAGLKSFEDILQENINELDKFQCTKISKADDPALIMCTSGTTGFPKGVLHSYGSVAHTISLFPINTTTNTFLSFSTLCWISELTLVLRSVTRVPMGTHIANRFSKTPDISKYDVTSVAEVVLFGASTTKEVILFLDNFFENADIYNAYGSTESLIVTIGKVDSSKSNSCGKICPNAQLKVVDPQSKATLGFNQTGELYCRSKSLMTGYWNNSAATEEVIDSEGWYHSGDLAYYDEDGNFFIVERIKELIKYKLRHVSPAVIENVILNLPGVAEVAVIAKPDDNDVELPMAFVKKNPLVQVTEDDIHQIVNDNLHDMMKLRGGIYFLEEMPHTVTGKISRKELRAMVKTLAA
ncbi:Similar to Luciferin 4-monooxygenase (Photuris pensylvanica) [Cotesia congregata]|uniref:Similar to Luciferin 4-monooxygenase (Photuris pensylvanica) n=1 Tax=Cotesia congregata TaxID=51543 RepID=A0A8J2GZM3_COTCN|nr:Similar to Luciferin 4-monooxygenase (Photuris pensylvanica) [Cotesia congregata]